jgi:hypothetical protein
MADPADLLAVRREVRVRALSNLLLVLGDVARGSAGRLTVTAAGGRTVLAYHDVRTMVRCRGGFALAVRDFSVVLVCPAAWPFERDATIVPIVVEPPDFRAPNSDGHILCIDVGGVEPERLAAVVYDTLRLEAFRLDHAVDWRAAAWVRAHAALVPADPRPLTPPAVEPSRRAPSSNGADAGGRGASNARRGGDVETVADVSGPAASPQAVVDVAAGVLGVAVPSITAPTILRLVVGDEPPAALVEQARRAYVAALAGQLAPGLAPLWDGVAALHVDPATPTAVVTASLETMAEAARALADPRVAERYLAAHQPGTGTVPI